MVDGRPEIVNDVAAGADDVRGYIGAEMRPLLDKRDFTEAFAGFLLPDVASQARRSLLEGRLRSRSPPSITRTCECLESDVYGLVAEL